MEDIQFGALNYTILIIYLAGMLGIGVYFSRKQESAEMFFLGGRKLPWIAVAMSMYASVTSAMTILSVPGTAYAQNIALIVVCIMSPIVAPFILILFYPLYHRLKITTTYEYIEKRFDRPARFAAAGLFILARLGWLATVVYAPAMAMSIVTGIPQWICICMMGLLSTIYTTLGGLAAVVWTDTIQFIILISGSIWIAISLANGVEGGFGEIMALAKETGRLHIADWKPSLYAMSAPVVAIAYFFQLMQEYGTDQVTVQRLMATGSYKKTVKSVAFNACTDFFIIGLLLFIGLGLFAFFQNTELPSGIIADKTLPYYIIHHLPIGISGLLITALFAAAMSSIDSGLNSIATVILTDFREISGNKVKYARILTIGLGIVATALAFYVSTIGNIIKSFYSFMGLFSMPILALFLLGVLTRKGNFKGWLIGLIASLGTSLWIQNKTEIHEIYYIPVSFFVSFGTALIASRFFQTPEAPQDLTVWKKN